MPLVMVGMQQTDSSPVSGLWYRAHHDTSRVEHWSTPEAAQGCAAKNTFGGCWGSEWVQTGGPELMVRSVKFRAVWAGPVDGTAGVVGIAIPEQDTAAQSTADSHR